MLGIRGLSPRHERAVARVRSRLERAQALDALQALDRLSVDERLLLALNESDGRPRGAT